MPSTRVYQLLTRMGVSRGAVGRWIRSRWRAQQAGLVDAEIRGVRYRLDIANNTTDEKLLTSSKIYDKVELDALKACARASTFAPRVFVDLGANTGYYLLNLAGDFERIIAIEPNPPTLALLRTNISLNRLQEKVELVPVCVGSGARVPFYCTGSLGTASLIRDNEHALPIMVDSLPLVDILQARGVEHITAMKVDIEGYEHEALRPFFDQAPESLWPGLVVIEHCHRIHWREDIIALMLSLGYHLSAKTRGNSILARRTS